MHAGRVNITKQNQQKTEQNSFVFLTYFGYKNRVGIDQHYGLILKWKTTGPPAMMGCAPP